MLPYHSLLPFEAVLQILANRWEHDQFSNCNFLFKISIHFKLGKMVLVIHTLRHSLQPPQPHWSWDPWDILCCATYYHTACWQLIVNTNLTWHRLIWTRIPVQDWIEGVGSRRCSFVGIHKSTVSCAIVYASLYNSLNTCSSCRPATLGLDRWCPDQTMRNWLSNGLTEIWGSTRSAFVTTGDLSLMER